MQIVIKLELIKGSRQMDIREQIKQMLFELGQEIKIHKIDQENMILEIDYDKTVDKIMQLLESSTYEQP